LFGAATTGSDTAAVRARIRAARDLQMKRAGKLNSLLTPRQIDQHCALDGAGRALVGRAMDRLGLSARGIHRVLKLARTLADLAGEPRINPAHLTEALAFREMKTPDY
jgi:magnesium chelatase family protein